MIAPVSADSLRKTGIFPNTAGDFGNLSVDLVGLGAQRQIRMHEMPVFPAYSWVSRKAGRKAGLGGWGGRDRTFTFPKRDAHQLDGHVRMRPLSSRSRRENLSFEKVGSLKTPNPRDFRQSRGASNLGNLRSVPIYGFPVVVKERGVGLMKRIASPVTRLLQPQPLKVGHV